MRTRDEILETAGRVLKYAAEGPLNPEPAEKWAQRCREVSDAMGHRATNLDWFFPAIAQAGGCPPEILGQFIEDWKGESPLPPDPPAPVYTRDTVLRGQFVIRGNYPKGPRPGSPDNPFFMDELDTIWKVDPVEAERILRDYVAKGANHITTGPVFARGYDNDYDWTNWVGNADQFGEFLKWIHAAAPGMYITLFALPDNAPYYHNGVFDWEAISNDLSPIFLHPDVQKHVARVVSQFECYTDTAAMRTMFEYLRFVFPGKLVLWHNPPGHLSPGLSNEEEAYCWQSAVNAGCHGLLYQAVPVDSDGVIGLPGVPIPGHSSMCYDLWDMARRLYDGYAGFPTHTPDGQRLLVEAGESTAHPIYQSGYSESLGKEWGAGALTVNGIFSTTDGLP